MRKDLQAARERYNISLCFYCKHASPAKCRFIKDGTAVYKDAATKIMAMQDTEEIAIIKIVTACGHYKEID